VKIRRQSPAEWRNPPTSNRTSWTAFMRFQKRPQSGQRGQPVRLTQVSRTPIGHVDTGSPTPRRLRRRIPIAKNDRQTVFAVADNDCFRIGGLRKLKRRLDAAPAQVLFDFAIDGGDSSSAANAGPLHTLGYKKSPATTGAATVIRKAHRFLSGLTPRRVAANLGVMNESLGLTSHNLSCNCTGCGMLRAGVCINCAEKAAAVILESGPGEVAVEPCSGACRTWSLCSWPVGDRSKAFNAVNAVLKRDDTSLQSQNSAGFPQICAIFQRDNLRRHF
jgi:hypothetical protein